MVQNISDFVHLPHLKRGALLCEILDFDWYSNQV